MDPIAHYQQAVAAFRDAKSQVESLVKVVRNGADVLAVWPKAMVSNAAASFPPEIGLNRSAPSINAANWPSGQQISDTLCAYHQAKQTAEQAYRAIPEAQRAVVQPPQAIVG